MVLLCKENALYVKCCIIPNGVEDSQGDTLYKEDIKKIFTSFNNQDNFEIYHNDLPIEEVSLLENYISTADETIGTQVVPGGSWNAVIRVDNPEIQDGLLTSEFGGVSLNNRIKAKCAANLHGKVRYQDIADAECIIPLLISFVKHGANGYGLHVMDYSAYIQKSDDSKKNGAKRMAFNLLDGLKSLIREAEASENEEPVILKEDNETTEETTAEQAVEETTEQAEIKKEDTTAEEEKEKGEDDATIEKEDAIASLEERIVSLEDRISELESKLDKTEETKEEESDETDEDTPKITKSASSKVIDKSTDETHIQNNNYFEMTGRDPLTGLPKKD